MVIKYTTFLFNIDGFLWDWKSLNEDFIKIFTVLLEHNRRVILLTNNSAYSKMHLTRKLQEKGLKDIEEENLFTSIDSLVHYLYGHNIAEVYVIGEYGLIKELENHNIHISSNSPYVVLGIDRGLTYEKLRRAYNILKDEESMLLHLDNALYWRIGNDNYPVTLPIISYLETALNKEINKLFLGKPSLYFKEALLHKYDLYSSTTILISNTKNDMLFASMLGVDAMLVTSNARRIIEELPPHAKPKYVVSDVVSVRDLL